MNLTPLLKVILGPIVISPCSPFITTLFKDVQLPSGFFLKASQGTSFIHKPPMHYTSLKPFVNIPQNLLWGGVWYGVVFGYGFEVSHRHFNRVVIGGLGAMGMICRGVGLALLITCAVWFFLFVNPKSPIRRNAK